jgi:acyl-CoA dehydrogenase
VLKAAWLIDNVGSKGARTEIAAIKVAAPRAALSVLDRAIQLHGGGGVSQDFPLARMWAHLRTLRLADGPDEVHLRTIARRELGRVSR